MKKTKRALIILLALIIFGASCLPNIGIQIPINEMTASAAVTKPVLKISKVTFYSAELSWTNVNAQKYIVYKTDMSTTPPNRIKVASVSGNTIKYTVTGLKASTTYKFEVEAYSGTEYSLSNSYNVSTDTESLPSSYNADITLNNIADSDNITPAKKQLVSGPCWIFASIATLESYIKKTTGATKDFSENHVRYAVSDGYSRLGFAGRTPGSGGSENIMAAYLMRGELSGPVLESDDPYTTSPGGTTMRNTWNSDAKKQGRVTGEQMIPNSTLQNAGADTNYRMKIKEAVLNYGGARVAYYSSSSNINEKLAYFYNSPEDAINNKTNTNHIVEIIGWDDNYPAVNFNTNPGGNGAWLVKNSTQGEKLDSKRIHWISYYQNIFNVAYFTGYDEIAAGGVYDYTPLVGFPQGDTEIFRGTAGEFRYWSNIYDCEDDNAYLEEVTIYVGEQNATYDIYVATGNGFNNTSATDNTLLNSAISSPAKGSLSVANGTNENKYKGYYTIKLNERVEVSNRSFAIVVKGKPVKNERLSYYYENTANNRISNKCESYYLTSQSPTSSSKWADLYNYSSGSGNFLIYAVVSGSNGKSDRKRVVRGDINRDGVCDINDITLLSKFISGKATLTPFQKIIANLDGYNGINSEDLLILTKIVNGEI